MGLTRSWLVVLAVAVAHIGYITCQFDNEDRLDRFVDIAQSCRNKEADVFFILDASSSIYIEDYDRQRQFVREVVQRMDISPRYTRVGAVVFSDNYRVAFDLNEHQSKQDLLSAVNDRNIPYLTGLTNTDDAIRYVRTSGQFRRDILKVIVVITDGYSREPRATAAESDQARREGFYLFVIGIGQYTDEREWRAIANDPDDNYMFNITNYRSLDRLYNTIPSRICVLPPIIISRDTCTVTRNADIMFVSGLRGASSAFTFVRNVVENIREGQGRLRLGLRLGECQAEEVPLSDPSSFCDDFGDTRVIRPDTYANLLSDMRETARDSRSRRPRVNQVAVLFLDNESMQLDQFGIYRQARDAQNDGITVFVVDQGVRDNRNFLGSIASSPDNVLSLLGAQNVRAVEQNLLQQVCRAMNAIPGLPNVPPPDQ